MVILWGFVYNETTFSKIARNYYRQILISMQVVFVFYFYKGGGENHEKLIFQNYHC